MKKKSFVDLEIKGKPNPENEDLIAPSNEYSFVDGDFSYGEDMEYGYDYLFDKNDLHSDVINSEDVLYACKSSTDNLIKVARNQRSIIISNNNVINNNWNGINEDLRYSSILSGAKNIYLDNFYDNENDYKLFLKNAEKNSHPVSNIVICSKRKTINSLANYCNFKRLKNSVEHMDENSIIRITKDSRDKMAHVVIGGKHSFVCDLAEDYQDKVTGLQDRDVLEKNSGMLFLYKKASDLYFHMGTVKFAIDIIFADENNKVLKIYGDVKPRSLGTFGCANSKTVLEIPGGYCSRNNIAEGDYISFNKLSELSSEDLSSALKPSTKSFSKIAKLSRYDQKISSPSILAIDESSIFPKGKTDFILNGSRIKWDTFKLFQSDNIKYNNVKVASFDLSKVSRESVEFPFTDKIVIYGDIEDTLVNKIAISKLFDSFSTKNIDFDILNTKEKEISSISKILKDKYSSEKVFFTNGPIYKMASFPVSESTKELARKADQRLLSSIKKLTNIMNDLDQNLSAYSAHKDNQEMIRGSKAQFHLSMKKIIEKYEDMLDSIKAAMKILYQIKDASQTEELIKGMSQSAAQLSDVLNAIFDLTEKVEDLEFFNMLSEKTENFKNLSKDSEFSIKGCREFIHSHILGILILS